eukprot:1159234-Pelagomonas_calceolata.AAC.7
MAQANPDMPSFLSSSHSKQPHYLRAHSQGKHAKIWAEPDTCLHSHFHAIQSNHRKYLRAHNSMLPGLCDPWSAQSQQACHDTGRPTDTCLPVGLWALSWAPPADGGATATLSLCTQH